MAYLDIHLHPIVKVAVSMVPLIGGIGDIYIYNHPIGNRYKWYILPIGGLYGTDPTYEGNQEAPLKLVGFVCIHDELYCSQMTHGTWIYLLESWMA